MDIPALVVQAGRDYGARHLSPYSVIEASIAGTPVLEKDGRKEWIVKVVADNERLLFVQVLTWPDGRLLAKKLQL